jgi:hypothetical protein
MYLVKDVELTDEYLGFKLWRSSNGMDQIAHIRFMFGPGWQKTLDATQLFRDVDAILYMPKNPYKPGTLSATDESNLCTAEQSKVNSRAAADMATSNAAAEAKWLERVS